ncbi:MAG: hypothetical protein AAGD38_00580 [Acidobacteriota bacterium]
MASTFLRTDVEGLARTNSTVVVAEVLSTESYWNDNADFILTEVHLQVSEAIKGADRNTEMVVTLPGGTVGDLSTLLIGGAQLQTGASYLLFLSKANLPGARGVKTVRDHAQGVFRIVDSQGQSRAISQANGLHLIADAKGLTQPPGGEVGLELDTLLESLRSMSDDTSTQQEVNR